MARYKAEVDKTKCIGAAICVEIDPSNYKLVEGKAEVQKQEFSELELKKNISAVKNCPTSAIRIIDLETGQEVK